MKSKILQLLLKRYLDKEASKQEQNLLESWYQSFDKQSAPILDLNQKENNLQSIRTKIGFYDASSNHPIIRRINPLWYKLVAGIVLVLGLFIGYKIWNVKQVDESTLETADIRYFESKVGERIRIDLPDQSHLTLNPSSKIQVDFASYNKAFREVKLIRGDVFFDVAPDSTKPFIVYAEELKTQVKGTSFLISSYPELSKQVVSVYTGRVMVSNEVGPLAELTKGLQLSLNKETNKVETRNFDIQNQVERDYGKILLKQVSFNELAVQFENYYGLRLQTKNQHILQQHYTIPINKQVKPETLIKVIAELHHNQFRKEGNMVIFY
ncbi:FecR family protein [Sphingobacterium kyonggiense]